MATADTAKLIAQLILEDKQFQAAIGRSTRSVSRLEGRFSKLGKNVSRGVSNAGRNLERGLAVGLTAVGGALAYSVKQATEAESAIAGIAKTVDGDISGVVESLKAMSNQIPVSFTELAGIAELGGAMGIARKDLAEFTKQVAILGTTTNVSVEDAATALGQMTNIIGLTGKEFDNFAAALVDLGNKGNSTEAQILEIARRSGGAAKLIGIAKEETLGWAAAAANLGLNEELAGTAVQSFFLKTQAAITAGGADLKDLAKISGKTTKQFKKDFDKNASGALTDFLKGLGKMTKDARLKTIQNIFGKGTGLTRLIVGLADSLDENLVPSLETSTTAWKEATAAQEEADKRFATSSSLFKVLRNNIDNAAATIGTNLLPVLVDLSKQGIAWLSDPKTQTAIRDFGRDLRDGARDAVKWLKSLDWDMIGEALQTAGRGAKAVADAFAGMPSWVQQAVLTGWGLNKLTGGALKDVFGDTFKLVFDQFAGRGASPANPIWVQSVGGGVGGGGGIPAVGGVAGALRLIPAAAIATAIIAAAVPIGEAFADALPDWLKGEGGLGKSESQTRLENAGVSSSSRGLRPGEVTKVIVERMLDGSALRDPELKGHRDSMEKQYRAIEGIRGAAVPSLGVMPSKLDALAASNSRSIDRATRSTVAEQIALKRGFAADAARITTAFRSGAGQISSAARRAGELAKSGGVIGGNTAARAIDRKDLSVDVDVSTSVNTSISIRDLGRTVTRTNRVNTTARTFL